MSKRVGVGVVLLAWVVPLLAGCKLGAVGGGFNYPPSWPIKELTVPAGAKQLALPTFGSETAEKLYRDGELVAAGAPQERRDWSVAFEYTGDARQLQDHVDACLKPLGFELWHAGVLPDQERRYITADRTKQVDLRYLNLSPIPMVKRPGWKGYTLSVAIWSSPRPDIASTQPIP